MKLTTRIESTPSGATLMLSLECASVADADATRAMLPDALDTYVRARKALEVARLAVALGNELLPVEWAAPSALVGPAREVALLEAILGLNAATHKGASRCD